MPSDDLNSYILSGFFFIKLSDIFSGGGVKHILPYLLIIILFLGTTGSADIGEGELASLRGAFMARIIKDNPGREDEIRRCLGLMVKDGNAGSRLIDRFAFFLYDSRRTNLELEKIRFLKDSGNTVFFIVMKDSSDGQLYSLYLEYSITGGAARLRDTYFSMIYGDRIKSVTKFFGGSE